MKVLVVVLGLVAHCLATEQYIVGGSAAGADEWRWQGGWLNLGSFSCGCSVIHQNWILTAGHCVGGAVGGYSVEVGSNVRGSGTRISVSSIVRHPDYQDGTIPGLGFTPNDIAVVGANVPIDGSSVIAVPGILDTDPMARLSQTCYITGWGRTCGSCPLPTNLQETIIPILDDATCESRYPVSFNAALHVCVWDSVNQDVGSCNGDSGGPLVCQTSATAAWDLVGVTSWGTSGCPTTEASVYTRVASYRQFVCDETGGAVGC